MSGVMQMSDPEWKWQVYPMYTERRCNYEDGRRTSSTWQLDHPDTSVINLAKHPSCHEELDGDKKAGKD